MERIFSYPITSRDEGMRIGDFLQAKGYSRHIRTFLKKNEGSILLNEIPAFFYQTLTCGDCLNVCLNETESSANILPVPLPIDIVYEDEDILIINKASDTPIHPSMGNYENTLANGVVWHFASQNLPFVYRCINRLDRDTTGLLIIARNMLSGAILSDQMKHRSIHRTYLAVAQGRLPSEGTIDAPIARTADSVIERCVDYERGERAVTHYKCLDYKPSADLSLVKLQLETGRTHQIRVHMAWLGHPLAGDTLYNPSCKPECTPGCDPEYIPGCKPEYTPACDPGRKPGLEIHRQALHSSELSFVHPITGQPVSFYAPLPDDMKRLISEH
jgi:23S rRNA pseudouridine1911/1915/1917 synthase